MVAWLPDWFPSPAFLPIRASASDVQLNGTLYSNATLTTSHKRSFRGTKGATYSYSVSSTDAAGNTASAGPFTHQN